MSARIDERPDLVGDADSAGGPLSDWGLWGAGRPDPAAVFGAAVFGLGWRSWDGAAADARRLVWQRHAHQRMDQVVEDLARSGRTMINEDYALPRLLLDGRAARADARRLAAYLGWWAHEDERATDVVVCALESLFSVATGLTERVALGAEAARARVVQVDARWHDSAWGAVSTTTREVCTHLMGAGETIVYEHLPIGAAVDREGAAELFGGVVRGYTVGGAPPVIGTPHRSWSSSVGVANAVAAAVLAHAAGDWWGALPLGAAGLLRWADAQGLYHVADGVSVFAWERPLRRTALALLERTELAADGDGSGAGSSDGGGAGVGAGGAPRGGRGRIL